MIDAVKLSEPKSEVILLLKKKRLARAAQDQPSQRIRPQERGNVLLNLPIRLKAKARARAMAKVDGSIGQKRANLRKAKRATPRRASPRKALRKAPPRRASPRASTTARARARSEAA